MHYMGVCDDDPEYMKKTVELLTNQADLFGIEITIHTFSTLKELIQTAEKQEYRMDMLFLDIEFGEEKSFETAKRVNELLPRCQIVFLTNYYSYVMDSYEIPHMYYVVKDEFPTRIDRILRMYFEKEESTRIQIIFGREIELVDIRDIYAVERVRRGSIVKLENEAKRTSLFFEDLLNQIHASYLIRCHNSFLVNLKHVQKYSTNAFYLTNGEIVPISRGYQQTVRAHFQRWQEVWI